MSKLKMYLLIVILPLIGSSVAGFFGRFLGSEGSAIMTTGGNLVLCGIVLFFCSILLGLFQVLLIKQYGKGLVLVIRTCLFFLIALYLGFLRGFFMSLFSFLVLSNELGGILCMVSGDGASSGANSGWTSILGQGDGSEFSVNQPTPTNSTPTGSASEAVENVIPPSQVELQQKKEELHSLVLRQFVHFADRGLKPWQVNTSDERIPLDRVCVQHIIESLEIEESVPEYEWWKAYLQENPTTLYPIFKDFKNP